MENYYQETNAVSVFPTDLPDHYPVMKKVKYKFQKFLVNAALKLGENKFYEAINLRIFNFLMLYN